MRLAIMVVAIGLIGLAGCGKSGSESGVPKNALPPDQSGEVVDLKEKLPTQGEKTKPLK